MTNVFISHGTPFNDYQKKFLDLIDNELKKNELKPVNLGRNNWSYKSPLKPIKRIMGTCKAAIIIGLERHHSYIGYDKEFSESHKEIIHKRSSTPWVQIEAGMAYQLGFPLLILKDKEVYAEGILDPNHSEFFVFEFDLEKNQVELTNELQQILLSWIRRVKRMRK